MPGRGKPARGILSVSHLLYAVSPSNLRVMPTLAIIFGIVLNAMGFGAYVASGAYTSLIPSGFGTLIFLSGLISVFVPKIRMHLMHVAALVGLLGTLGGLGMGLPKLGALLSGTAERPLASGMQIAMGVVCLVFLVLCVKSFIDARKKTKSLPRMIRCSACSVEVSSQAYTCPQCGQPLNKSENPAEKTYQRIKWFTIGVGLLVLAILLGGCPNIVVFK